MPLVRIGTIALADIKSGDRYLSVPQSVILDEYTALSDMDFRPLLRALRGAYKGRDDFHEAQGQEQPSRHRRIDRHVSRTGVKPDFTDAVFAAGGPADEQSSEGEEEEGAGEGACQGELHFASFFLKRKRRGEPKGGAGVEEEEKKKKKSRRRKGSLRGEISLFFLWQKRKGDALLRQSIFTVSVMCPSSSSVLSASQGKGKERGEKETRAGDPCG